MKTGTRQTVTGTVLERTAYRNAKGRFQLDLILRPDSTESDREARRVIVRGKEAFGLRRVQPGDRVTALGRTYRLRKG